MQGLAVPPTSTITYSSTAPEYRVDLTNAVEDLKVQLIITDVNGGATSVDFGSYISIETYCVGV